MACPRLLVSPLSDMYDSICPLLNMGMSNRYKLPFANNSKGWWRPATLSAKFPACPGTGLCSWWSCDTQQELQESNRQTLKITPFKPETCGSHSSRPHGHWTTTDQQHFFNGAKEDAAGHSSYGLQEAPNSSRQGRLWNHLNQWETIWQWECAKENLCGMLRSQNSPNFYSTSWCICW